MKGWRLLADCSQFRLEPGALAGEDVWARVSVYPAAHACAESFTRLLAGVARDIVLATAAWGGVFLSGGVVLGWARQTDAELFRSIFEEGGPVTRFLQRTCSAVIVRDEVALMGLTQMPLRQGAGDHAAAQR